MQGSWFFWISEKKEPLISVNKGVISKRLGVVTTRYAWSDWNDSSGVGNGGKAIKYFRPSQVAQGQTDTTNGRSPRGNESYLDDPKSSKCVSCLTFFTQGIQIVEEYNLQPPLVNKDGLLLKSLKGFSIRMWEIMHRVYKQVKFFRYNPLLHNDEVIYRYRLNAKAISDFEGQQKWGQGYCRGLYGGWHGGGRRGHHGD